MSGFFLISFVFLCNNLFGDTTITTNTTLGADNRWSLSNKLFVNASATLTGNSLSCISTFPHNADQVWVVGNSNVLTVQSLFLKNFSPDHVSLGSGSSIIFDSASYILFLKNESLNYSWYFGATSTLDGNGKRLTLGSSGNIVVQAGGSLKIKDLTIYDVTGTNLRCASNTATITFDNVNIVNRNVWNFQNGAFAVTNNLSMTGGGKFVYQSAYASTINDNSTLFLTDGMTFSYDPAKGSGQSVAGQENLVFTNTSSKLWCDGVTLKITTTGMRITKGTLQFDRKNSVYSDVGVADITRGFVLGDGDYRNDPQINFGPDSKLNIDNGVVQYALAEDNTIKAGDKITLKNTLYGFYLQSSPFEIGGHAHYLLGNSLKINEVAWYFTQNTGQPSGWFYGTLPFVNTYGIQGGSINLGHAYTYWYGPAPVSTPFPPYAGGIATAQGNQVYEFQTPPGRTDLRYGDIISFPVGSVGYLGTSNLHHLTYNSINYKEIYMYVTGTPTPPPNNSHWWLVEKY